MYKYDTHCHTFPVSRCGKAGVEETIRFYKSLGYDGIFITNHFLDGNVNPAVWELSYREQIDYYFSDYEKGAELGADLGLKVFPGVELSWMGTDFVIYGLEKDWYKEHPSILGMNKKEELAFMEEAGALIIQAHPYREAHYIDHIRLFPRSVHGVEVINSNQTDLANEMASIYAERYGLLKTAGSDNHWGSGVFDHLREKGFRAEIAGMCSDTEIRGVQDFIGRVREGTLGIFYTDEKGNTYTVPE